MKLIIRYERRGHTSTQSVFRNGIVFSGAEDKSNAWIIAWILNIDQGIKDKVQAAPNVPGKTP